jgi:hypothetical protein
MMLVLAKALLFLWLYFYGNMCQLRSMGGDSMEIRFAPITDVATLQVALQNAIRLEHATIPPYLIAYYTLTGGSPSVAYARRSIKAIVNQEMLHLTLACNILNAIKGTPQIADPAFVPKYPDHLPMGVESSLIVHLKRYSRDLVENAFMKIEEPEVPINIPVKALAFAPAEIRTIGQFYAAIRTEIMRQGDRIFVGDRGRQVKGVLGAIEVTDVTSAVAAIDTIVHQGEGTPTSPIGMGSVVAHYYRFQELAKGMKIVPDALSPVGFSFDPQQPISIDDSSDVIQMVDDPELLKFEPADAKASQLADACDVAYSDLLRILQDAFNGQPARITDAIGQMTPVLESAIEEVLAVQLTAGVDAGKFAGPRFKFVA